MFLDIMAWEKLALFTGGELLFSLTPGPTVVMISAYGFKGGFRDALSANCGTQTANTLWYLLCALGLGALLAASPLAFAVIRYLGAAYLIWLGASALWHSRKTNGEPRAAKLRANPFVQAFLTQMGNPKALLFFGAFVPQFLDTRAPLLPQYAVMYVITLIGEGLILAGYGRLAAAGGRMAATHHAVWRERISGTVLIGLGMLFAAAPR
ncbi:MAG TPA: LysE family translocator [Rhizomicrobium sp.]|nr:LysE family translocator [Rhizomicrobium sp.]